MAKQCRMKKGGEQGEAESGTFTRDADQVPKVSWSKKETESGLGIPLFLFFFCKAM